ncbi:hypothetical protein PRIPAC_73758, partial [Pristionchus pacificus]|uniref:G protein-coupled receptor n=1 Tax=Pristionchus pacificus TaxID=54126 RepID=A0A2A6CRD5_PRIPA
VGRVSAYTDFCYGTLLLSVLLNGMLARVANRRHDRIGFYRYFTFAFVVIDVSYSLAFAIVQPFCFSAPNILVYFSTAPWNDRFTLVRVSLSIRVSMQIWLALFSAVIFCVSSSFVYRYGLLCRPFLVSMFEQPRRCLITAMFLTFMNGVWICNYNFLIFHDSQEVRNEVQLLFGTEYNSEFDNAYMLIVDLNIFCGWRIHVTVKTAAMSNRLKKMHRKALKMLIAQPLAHLLALFPIFNPIIVIYFTDDYKRYLLGQSTSQPQSSNKTELRDMHSVAGSRHFMPI